MEWYILFSAFFMDLLLADPSLLPHPVVLMGEAIEFFEPFFRKILSGRVLAGFLFSCFLIVSTFILTYGLIRLSSYIDPVFGSIVSIVLMFYTLSGKSLYTAALKVKTALEDQGVEGGRDEVSMIVGREVKHLDETGVVRACVESVAENFVDGFLSPLFFGMVGGVPMAMAYKMINTLDSMVGYKNEKYIEFGKASARIDDIANYIPARISLLIIALSTLILSGKRGVSSFKTGMKDGRLHKSPNAGLPEAAFAGALLVKLGGPSYYHGKLVEKPYIGKGFNDPSMEHIKQAAELMLFASFVSMIISLFFTPGPALLFN